MELRLIKILLALFFTAFCSYAQDNLSFSGARRVVPADKVGFEVGEEEANMLRKSLATVVDDTLKINVLIDLCDHYKFYRPDSSLRYGYQALSLAREIGYYIGEARVQQFMVVTYLAIGDNAKALVVNRQAKRVSRDHGLIFDEAISLNEFGRIQSRMGNYDTAFISFRRAIEISDSVGQFPFSTISKVWMAKTFVKTHQYDSAEKYGLLAYNQANAIEEPWHKGFASSVLAEAAFGKGKANRAISLYLKSKEVLTDYFDPNLEIAKIYESLNKRDSSLYFANEALRIAKSNGFYDNLIKIEEYISELLKSENPNLALQHLTNANLYKDRLMEFGQTSAIESFITSRERQQQIELESAEKEYTSKIRTNALLGSTFTFLVVAFVLWRSRSQNQKSRRKTEVAYERLKNTQSQLIQSEKMASLGELTAGIAHEIQNPLNFVNNFSEVNSEMLQELKEEIEKGNSEEAKAIADDLIDNESKINQHGQRAEGIVKGMLQHSRTSEGEKELTDLNVLADEYLRLAYHGMRAKDKSFNADFKTDFDESLPKVEVVPQDIGRVLLNLINNAFYAVSEASHPAPEATDGDEATEDGSYQPLVTVSTKLSPSPRGIKGEEKIEISVSDKGPGIPDDIKDKIFQPFFTTKPTGSGTGLGLSLSYDIIKAHGGEFEVKSKVGEGTSFTIRLPNI